MSSANTNLSTTKQALLALKQLQAKLDAMEEAKHEPIAIVGTSCRFPGGSNSPEDFWQRLEQKTDAITEVPEDRWSLEAYYSNDPKAPGKMISRHGGFVPRPYDFDASFFHISPREAITLDPQQRLLLELGWESLERAGIAPNTLNGKPVGLFVGISSIDYWQRALAQQVDEMDPYLVTGNTHSVAAGRLSFLLGLTGPSLAIDTACSSSLVALHLACQSLRQQECTMALAGGVNRILTPEASINFSKAGMLSADGRCRTFDKDASGFGRGEGGGMAVLKRLSDAQTDGDSVHAIILGSAVNHDGQASGLTVPNGPAQQRVIRQALQASRIDPEEVSYIEAHGTGTSLGDPIEVGALGQVFSSSQSKDHSLILGSVKTNIGHLEAAAGMASLIKVTSALQHHSIPGNLHLNTPNPNIEWDNLPFQVPTTNIPWPSQEKPRIAGISGFGFSGTNAHVIVSELLSSEPQSSHSDSQGLLPLSARTPVALNQLVARYAQYLANYPDIDLGDLCFTASIGRCHFSHRLAIIASSISELRQILIDVLAGRSNPNCWRSDTASEESDLDSLQNLAQRYVQGETINWQNWYQQGNYRNITLPTYPFQRQYYGLD